MRYVPIVYDVIPLLLPHLFEPWLPVRFEQWFVETVRAADAVVTISENSRRDVLRLARERSIGAPPVTVVRLGDDLPAHEAVRPTALAGCAAEVPFVLMVGTVEPRKNHALAYHVWRRLIERHGARAPRLVIAGGEGWLTGDLRQHIARDPLTRDRVVWLNRVSGAELAWLYRNCLFAVYPSWYEGWGLPVAECLAHGKYCIASDRSSLPEVGGDLVGYHDPLDAVHMLRLVEEAAFDPELRTAREVEVRSRYVTTMWAQTADRLFAELARLSDGTARPGAAA